MTSRRLALTILVVTGLGYAFDGYNNSVFGLALPWMVKSLHLSLVEIGGITSVFLFLYATRLAPGFSDTWPTSGGESPS